MELYVVVSLLVLVLVVATCVAFTVGLLGEFGVVRLTRCPECAHVLMASRGNEQPACPYCRHDRLAHPLRTMRHPVRELAHR